MHAKSRKTFLKFLELGLGNALKRQACVSAGRTANIESRFGVR